MGHSSIKINTGNKKSIIWKNATLKAFATNIENNHKKAASCQRIAQTAGDKFFAAGHIRAFQNTAQVK